MPRINKLRRRDLDRDPIRQFLSWYRRAFKARVVMPDAMILATATRSGLPSARAVALRGIDERGLVFYTDRRSRKGKELNANPRAALVFYWGEIGRQVRVSGRTARLTKAESESYFRTRPRGSRLAAWSSHQGRPIADRAALEAAFRRNAASHDQDEIPLPPWWGGYRLVPATMEFWQSHPDRLHDRFLYRRHRDRWLVERLSP